MVDVLVIRSGCTDYDEQHRIQGALDIPLNAQGQLDVESLVAHLAGTELDVIYAAPCDSARATAEAIGASLDVPVKELEGLRNLDQGLWEGLTVDEVRRKYPKMYKQWNEAPESVRPPEGETVTEAMERVRQVLKRPCKRKDAIAVVAPEPLATLVTCVISGHRPDSKIPAERKADAPVERLQVSGALPPLAESNGSDTEKASPEAQRGKESA